MDVDDENESSIKQVSIYLIQCFQGITNQPNSVAKLDFVLKKITTNLTFDHPGMFAESILLVERVRQMQDATVMWLINEVIYEANQSSQ